MSKVTFTKESIASIMNEEIGLPKGECIKIINDILAEIKAGLLLNKKVKLSSFGTFVVNKKGARPGNNLKTSERVMIKERNSISFRPSKIIKKLINHE